ncbi:hypothetical protein D3C73_1373150 [compost metagenome]
MLALVKGGKIPNSLLSVANNLFDGKTSVKEDDEKALSNLFEVLDVVCEACFLQPSYKELKDAEIELTDDQLMYIFNYTQVGVKALENFRK